MGRTVGQNIRAAREQIGLSQTDLADLLGVRQPTVWKLEKQRGLPKLPVLFRVATVLKTNVEALVDGVSDAYKPRRSDLPGHTPVKNGAASATTKEAPYDAASADPCILQELRHRNDVLVQTLRAVRKVDDERSVEIAKLIDETVGRQDGPPAARKAHRGKDGREHHRRTS